VRRDQKPGDYSDPGWYTQPPGTQAFEWTGKLAEPARFQAEVASNNGVVPGLHNASPAPPSVRKPTGHSNH
jgi:manganese oxidase